MPETSATAERTPWPSTGFVDQKQILGPGRPIPLGPSAWWQGIKEGRFPQPVKIGGRTVWRVKLWSRDWPRILPVQIIKYFEFFLRVACFAYRKRARDTEVARDRGNFAAGHDVFQFPGFARRHRRTAGFGMAR